MAKVKEECIQIYGHDFAECGKRLVCFGKHCLGREMEWKSPTALPYLTKWASLVGIKIGDDYFIQTDCSTCPIFKTCKATCAQVNDFMNRDRTGEPELVYRETTDNIVMEASSADTISRILGTNIKVPWDAVNKTRRDVIKKYLYDQKNFLTIAKELGLTDQARARYEFYSGLTTLSEYGTFRAFLEEKGEALTKLQRDVLTMVYIANINIVQTAKVLETSKQAVQQVITRVVQKHGLKWTVFVKKEKNKLIYNVPELLK